MLFLRVSRKRAFVAVKLAVTMLPLEVVVHMLIILAHIVTENTLKFWMLVFFCSMLDKGGKVACKKNS